ncbi:unnamed protein product [Adineta ricciae]|nr:unnamed protein product [Adineta ricciae]
MIEDPPHRTQNCDPSSVYIPLESLTEPTVRSVINVVVPHYSLNWDHSERTLLIFLLALNKKLTDIENSFESDEKKLDQRIIEHARQVRAWLVDRNNQPLDWKELQKNYDDTCDKKHDALANYHHADNANPYFELDMKTPHKVVKQSREYMKKFRAEGFKPEELKVYWNAEQLESLCPTEGEDEDKISYDPSDKDAYENLRQYPVASRRNRGEITYVTNGIEKAVFDIPEDAQIIVLNFANEQSPGGGYLRRAMAQEEVILYNSDGYRALLDLKYQRMCGGYAIPEFGLAYVRNMRFFDAHDEKKYRKTDMLVSACYCLHGSELYNNPENDDELEKNNVAKFRAFISAAVANTIGDGKNTYLLLGPIGTGAFGNDVDKIAKVFKKVLDMNMMGSNGPIRYAFEHIWFVSIDDWKNDAFEKYIPSIESSKGEVF